MTSTVFGVLLVVSVMLSTSVEAGEQKKPPGCGEKDQACSMSDDKCCPGYACTRYCVGGCNPAITISCRPAGDASSETEVEAYEWLMQQARDDKW